MVGEVNKQATRIDNEVIELSSDEEPCSSSTHLYSNGSMSHQRGVADSVGRRKRRVRLDEDLDKADLTSEGKLLVNQGRPREDPDVFVAQHLAGVLQPHQIGGIRFLYVP